MAEIYLDLLILICLGLLGWGLIRLERVYQYPFFMGSIFVSFLVPQGFALINSPGLVSQEALARVLIVSSLCAAMCWLGYQFKPNTKFLKTLNIPIDSRKLVKAGLVLTAIGHFFSFLISRTAPEAAENGNWTGVITIYYFFASVSYIAFAILFVLTLRQPTIKKIIFTIIAAYPPFSAVFESGRRQGTAAFILIIGLSLFYVYRYLPPRWLVIAAVVLTLLLLPIIGQYRGEFWAMVFSGNLGKIDFTEGLNKVLEGKVLELRNAAILMDAAERTGQYTYGTGYWDSLVFRYIPGQILGRYFKESLQFKLGNYDLVTLFGYRIPSGSTPTGIGDSFLEFSYFGCLFFAVQAYVFKHLWISSVHLESIFSQILYMGLLSPALVGLTHGTSRFFQDGLFQLIFVGLVAVYSRKKSKSFSLHHPN